MAKINQEACLGCGVCAGICPDVFEIDETKGKAKIKEGANCQVPCFKEAQESCPAQAIEE